MSFATAGSATAYRHGDSQPPGPRQSSIGEATRGSIASAGAASAFSSCGARDSTMSGLLELLAKRGCPQGINCALQASGRQNTAAESYRTGGVSR